MLNPTSTSLRDTPWHLWVVGVLSVLWNAFGVFDFVMTESHNVAYLSAFTPAQLEYLESFPIWLMAVWGLSVWAALIGAVLLLLRRRLAVAMFFASLLAMVATFFHNYVLTDGLAVMGGIGGLVFAVVILVIGVLLLVYARRLAGSGVLR